MKKQYEHIADNHTKWAFIVALFVTNLNFARIPIRQNIALDKRLLYISFSTFYGQSQYSLKNQRKVKDF